MSNAAYLGTSLDNPPVSTDDSYMTRTGRVCNVLMTRTVVPVDAYAFAAEQGIDIPYLTRSND